MTRIDFYHGAEDRLAAVASLLRKVCQRRLRALVFAPDAGLGQALDRLLWTTPPLAFVPHCRADSALAPQTPILIADHLEPIPFDDLLFNLGHELPPGFARFQRLIEVIGGDDDPAPARERFRFYRDHGYEIASHNLSQRA